MLFSQSEIKRYARLFFTGFSMGSADIVPGVSGGTIAFIFGIYHELLDSISTVTSKVPKLLFKGEVRKAIELVPFRFLVPLGLGLVSAVLLLTELVAHLLATQPVFVWSFFFGLVLASIFLVSKRIKNWTLKDYAVLLVGTVAAYVIVGLVSFETAATPLAFVLAGAIAICAMILPGISGSFLLVIMGKYEQILQAVAQRDIMTLGLVFIGMLIGITLFSKVLSWLFEHYHDVIVAALAGFMIGSLRKVWPWKETLTTRINSHGLEVPVAQQNIFPEVFDGYFYGALALCLLGTALIIVLDKYSFTDEASASTPDVTPSKKRS